MLRSDAKILVRGLFFTHISRKISHVFGKKSIVFWKKSHVFGGSSDMLCKSVAQRENKKIILRILYFLR